MPRVHQNCDGVGVNWEFRAQAGTESKISGPCPSVRDRCLLKHWKGHLKKKPGTSGSGFSVNKSIIRVLFRLLNPNTKLKPNPLEAALGQYYNGG